MATCSKTVSTLVVMVLAGLAAGGPLVPAAGPVNSTMKTLAEVEPRTAINATNTPGDAASVFRITQSGSYYLTGNVSVPVGKSGIVVAASNVTLDLNGFTIEGQAGSLSGVFSSGERGVRVRNGTVVGMPQSGVRMSMADAGAEAYEVTNVTVRGSGGSGIEITDGLVRACQVTACGTVGVWITTDTSSMVEETSVTACGNTGILMQEGIVRGCVVKGTPTGVSLASGTVKDCTAIGNNIGVVLGRGQVVDCSALGNVSTGILVNGGGTVRGNVISAPTLVVNTVGIRVETTDGSLIEGNTVVRQNTGVSCATANNLIVKNGFRGCTNAVNLAANNRLGPLVSATAQPAITGNSGGGLGATDANANLLY